MNVFTHILTGYNSLTWSHALKEKISGRLMKLRVGPSFRVFFNNYRKTEGGGRKKNWGALKASLGGKSVQSPKSVTQKLTEI